MIFIDHRSSTVTNRTVERPQAGPVAINVAICQLMAESPGVGPVGPIFFLYPMINNHSHRKMIITYYDDYDHHIQSFFHYNYNIPFGNFTVRHRKIHHFLLIGKPSINGQFSMAMLNNQRVL